MEAWCSSQTWLREWGGEEVREGFLGKEAGGFGQVERRWDRVGNSDPFTWEALSQPQGA